MLADVAVSTPVTSFELAKQLPNVVTNIVADPDLVTPQTAVSNYLALAHLSQTLAHSTAADSTHCGVDELI